MNWRSSGWLGLALAGVGVAGFIAGISGSQPHGEMAIAAATLMFSAAIAASVAEALIARQGGEALVLAYWVGVGVRGTVGLAGVLLLARFGFDPQDRKALVLWLLTSYLVVLTLETVRSVRTADRQRLAKSGRAGRLHD